MARLELTDSLRLQVADDLLAQGNTHGAKMELSRLSPETNSHPEVIKRYWKIRYSESDWDECARLASEFRHQFPEDSFTWMAQAKLLRQQDRIQEAWELLHAKFRVYPRDWEVSFELARYSCLLGQYDDAINWMTQAILLDQQAALRAQIMHDSDFRPIWPDLARLNLARMKPAAVA